MRRFNYTEHFRDAFKEDGCIVIRGMFDPQEVIELRDALRSSFKPERDGEGKIAPHCSAQVLRDVTDGKLPRFVRMLYEPPTRDIFLRLVELRNHLIGKPTSWALQPEDGWWTASRFNQYPVGGGFMNGHRDAEYIGDEPPGGYAQTLLMMTKKGKDFYLGGGYAANKSGFELVDEQCEIGDVLVYDGKIFHGVDPIDPYKHKDLKTFSGRIVATVSTLKVL